MSSKYLVLGAGELGMAVVRGLARRAASEPAGTVAVLLRPGSVASADPAKLRIVAELEFLGVRTVTGDLTAGSDGDLSALFEGFHTVISCTGFVGGPGFQRRLTRAVLAAGVGRHIPWQFGVDYDEIGRGSPQDLWDEQLDVRNLLRAQNRTEWVIVSTGMFTSFLFDPAFGVVDVAQNTVTALGGWDHAVTVTAPEDIGTLTAEVCFAEPQIADQVVYTAGDTITYARLADVVDATLGRRLHRIERTVRELEDELAADPGDAIKKYRLAFAQGRGVSWDPGRTLNVQKGIPVKSVERWVREYVQ